VREDPQTAQSAMASECLDLGCMYADTHAEVERLDGEEQRLKAALIALIAWIDGWRDMYDNQLEARWKVGFTDTTPELVGARAALDQEGHDASH